MVHPEGQRLLRSRGSGRRLGKVEMQAFLFRSAPTLVEPGFSSPYGDHGKAGARPALSVVHPEGLEPTTLCSEDRCSNPLSYGCTNDIIPSGKGKRELIVKYILLSISIIQLI